MVIDRKKLLSRIWNLFFILSVIFLAVKIGQYMLDLGDAYVYVDKSTGCEYIGIYGGGMTPRLAHDGKHAGCYE